VTARAANETSPAPRSGRFALEWWMPPAVFLAALVLRLYNLASIPEPYDDAALHTVNDITYSAHGLLGPDYWWTQPMKHLTMFVSVRLFGNDELGWHMRETLLGALAVLLVFLIAREAFGRLFPAVAAAALLALDPLSVAMARNSTEDVGASCLMLLAILLSMRVLRRGRDVDRVLAGIAIGLAVATRWWTAAPVVIMLGIVAWRSRGRLRELPSQLAFLVVLPLAVYVLAYLPWFSAAHTLSDFVSLQRDALLSQGAANAAVYPSLALSGPGRWFVSVVAGGPSTPVVGDIARYSVMMNDPVLWVLFVPAVAYLLWVSVTRRRAVGILLGGTFVLLYGFFVSSPRPIFLYSASAIIGLGFIAVGFAVDRLARQWEWKLLAGAAAWSLYLYPFVSGAAVQTSLYAWIVHAMRV
jgi:dolichyl-phosphate-mannose-protein mannosyltransferase